jgi:hypothetical protein
MHVLILEQCRFYSMTYFSIYSIVLRNQHLEIKKDCLGAFNGSRAEVLRRFQSVLFALFCVNDCNIQSPYFFLTFCVKKHHKTEFYILGLCVK